MYTAHVLNRVSTRVVFMFPWYPGISRITTAVLNISLLSVMFLVVTACRTAFTSSSRLVHSFHCSFSHAKGTQVTFRALPKGRASWIFAMLWPDIAIHERGSERPTCAPSGFTARITTWSPECSELYNTKNLHQEPTELWRTTLEGIAYPRYCSHSD